VVQKWRFLLVAVATSAACAMAQPARDPVETRLEARKVSRDAEGREGFASADAARPGETIEYVATYRNTGKQAVRDLAATLPIPSSTEFISGSARPANAMASVDGSAYAAIPLKRRVMRDGKSVEEEVPAREYRYLRWFPGELGADKSVSFTARVRVVDAEAPPGQQKAGAK
jgi:uncharacterized repeat protein (TIGR01451 family)